MRKKEKTTDPVAYIFLKHQCDKGRMKVSVEISYYPLQNMDFADPIRDFIDRLNRHTGIRTLTNGMSTQVFGEYDEVMKILQDEIRVSFSNPYSVFAMKLVNADLQIFP